MPPFILPFLNFIAHLPSPPLAMLSTPSARSSAASSSASHRANKRRSFHVKWITSLTNNYELRATLPVLFRRAKNLQIDEERRKSINYKWSMRIWIIVSYIQRTFCSKKMLNAYFGQLSRDLSVFHIFPIIEEEKETLNHVTELFYHLISLAAHRSEIGLRGTDAAADVGSKLTLSE